MKLLLGAITALSLAGAAVAQTPAAVISDPPRDAAHPAAMEYVRIPSHGALLNGVLYRPSGAGPHPTLLLLHGFPGNEQNLDLAQAVRRAGFNVLTLHYRGSWGSPGSFSFTHAREDADAAVSFLRTPAIQAKFGVDPTRVFVAGHSMGGFMAASAVAHDPRVAGLIMISAWNIAGEVRGGAAVAKARAHASDSDFADNVIPLGGATVDGLIDEIAAAPKGWDFPAFAPPSGMTLSAKSESEAWAFAPRIAPRPVLLVTAEDGSQPASHALAEALSKAGDREVREVHMVTDHPFSDHRIALESAVVDWLTRYSAAH
jgi:pimeloyl-ACP methyl ester carboxylesterase